METQSATTSPNTPSFLDKPIAAFLPELNWEKLAIALILIAAVVSRFYILDLRVMSHDEVNHVVPSFDLFQGKGYRHDPVTHGPIQFHMIALSYFLFGDNDMSSRTPAALFSIATVAFVLLGYRRYLGRLGALIAGLLFLISPYMLFYGRYTRNEAFVALFGVVMLYAVLRYLDKGDHIALYLLSASIALHFTSKETSYIYVAQLLIFMAIIFLGAVLRQTWGDDGRRKWFAVLISAAMASFGLALGFAAWNATVNKESVQAASDLASAPVPFSLTPLLTAELVALVLAVLLGIGAVVFLVRGLGWKAIRSERSFDLLILVGTLILPLLTAFPVKMVGWNPLDYSNEGILKTSIFLLLLSAVSVGIGYWWNPGVWFRNVALFYGIFVVFYTTFFTNGQGFFTGMVGSLGYWLSQQGVERGSQPWYYYALIQVPVYEYLAALGSIIALYFGLRYGKFSTFAGISPADEQTLPLPNETDKKSSERKDKEEAPPPAVPLPTLALFLFWSITSLVAYSVAGEKMPWLTVHIALGLLLAAGWGLGYLVETTPWKKIGGYQGWIALLLVPVFLSGLTAVMGSLLGSQPPFQGNTLDQLQSTSTFILAVVTTLASAYGIFALLKDWGIFEILRLGTVAFFALLTLLTARTAYRASYVNYDYATEYLVYAHAAPGPKQVLAQVEEISRRTTRGLDVVVAYDNDGLYPYWWYLRNYPNHKWFTDKPTRELRDTPLIIAGEGNFGKLDSIVKDNFIQFDYMRLWWPNQDYFNLTWERIWNVISNREMRAAVFNIWLNRDYTEYGKLTNNPSLKPETWQPSSRMRFYIRKDIVAQMWNYGAAPAVAQTTVTDPYESKLLTLNPDLVVGAPGSAEGQFQTPRGMALAKDDSFYVADSKNHRIQHLSADGKVLQVWGSFADASKAQAPGGSFNEPWGVAVGPDGSVYVTDTWNHRVQKFTADGQFVKMWGYFGQAEKPEAMWGPRGIAVDQQGRVYVTDTGNKRVVIFDADGNSVSQFGSAGMDAGQFDEPVGIALDKKGNVYVNDTWNQRVQVFAAASDGIMFTPMQASDVYGWFGQSLDNKPFIAVDDAGNYLVTDPDGYRVLKFDPSGQFVLGWGSFSAGVDGFGLPSGVMVDHEGRVWVSDAVNHDLLRFTLPAK